MREKMTIRNSLKFIEENLECAISLETISANAGYSRFYFARIFKAHMGISVMEYVKKRRLAKASEELLKGGRLIDIALNYGYSSHSSFSKAFRLEYGFSPALLRAMVMQMESLGGNQMNKLDATSVREYMSQETLLEQLKQEIVKQAIPVSTSQLQKVYEFASCSYEGVKRYSGEDYITHTLYTSILLAQMGAGKNEIMAGLLCDVLSKTNVTEQDLIHHVPVAVADIIVHLHNFDAGSWEKEKEEVILVKLAERLHNMRTLEYMKGEERKNKAKETIDYFLPIAAKLGDEKFFMELNELSLKYI